MCRKSGRGGWGQGSGRCAGGGRTGSAAGRGRGRTGGGGDAAVLAVAGTHGACVLQLLVAVHGALVAVAVLLVAVHVVAVHGALVAVAVLLVLVAVLLLVAVVVLVVLLVAVHVAAVRLPAFLHSLGVENVQVNRRTVASSHARSLDE